MSPIEQTIQQFEARPAAYNSAEQGRRTAMLKHLTEINQFEGIVPSSVDQRLFQLLASGKISKHEYLALCLADARGAM